MLRWLGPAGEAPEPAIGQADRPIPSILQQNGNVTDDPLAAACDPRSGPIYSVSRSVYLPRVTLKAPGVNPLFRFGHGHSPPEKRCEKSSSSGYGSSLEPLYVDSNAVAVLEQNSNYVKSIKIAGGTNRTGRRSLPSSGSSGGGTLTTIPEGRPPEPIWPNSLSDEVLLPSLCPTIRPADDALDVLVDLLHSIAEAADSNRRSPEQVLQTVSDRIAASIENLRASTEDEVRRLCVNLSNCRRINSVLRAFSHTSSSSTTGGSSGEDIYHVPCEDGGGLPVFIHEDLGSVPNGVRNAMIYGTLYRGGGMMKKQQQQPVVVPKKNAAVLPLKAINDGKPSVWEQYYGVRAQQQHQQSGKEVEYVPKPTDVPLFPGGRPEADFTLDVPRSELLSKRMKQDKKWRCRCRLLTSFLGLIFFLLSVMAVSLMLTRGKRMFGSMM